MCNRKSNVGKKVNKNRIMTDALLALGQDPLQKKKNPFHMQTSGSCLTLLTHSTSFNRVLVMMLGLDGGNVSDRYKQAMLMLASVCRLPICLLCVVWWGWERGNVFVCVSSAMNGNVSVMDCIFMYLIIIWQTIFFIKKMSSSRPGLLLSKSHISAKHAQMRNKWEWINKNNAKELLCSISSIKYSEKARCQNCFASQNIHREDRNVGQKDHTHVLSFKSHTCNLH